MDMLDVHVYRMALLRTVEPLSRYTTDFYLNLRCLEAAREINEPKHLEKLTTSRSSGASHSTRWNDSPLVMKMEGVFFQDFMPANDFRPTLALGAALLGRNDLKFVAGGASPELFGCWEPKVVGF